MRLPIPSWLLTYQREWLTSDLVAGVTAAAILIPKAMAYALIAGLSVEAGIYTVLAAMLVYPLLGSSRLLMVSSTTALAMMTATAIAGVAQAQGAAPAAVAATLALLAGGVLVGASLLRLGFLANFISLPVLIGFQAGVGIVVVVAQFKAILGVHVESKTTVGTLLELPGLLPQIHVLTLVVAAITLAMLIGLERLFPRRPIALLLVGSSIGASLLFGFDSLGVKTVGAFPPGLPSLSLPDVSLVVWLWPAALGVALMSFTESVAAARMFWQSDERPVSANQELFALGAANAAAAVIGGMAAGGGASQIGIAAQAGARSQFTQLVGAGCALLTLLFLAAAIAALPEAVLAAVVLITGVGMVQPRQFAAIARVRRTELAWALATVAGVVLVGTLEGILLAVAFSVLTLVYQANRPPVYAVAYNREQRVFRRVGESEADETFPGLLILRAEGRLTFANAENAGNKIRTLVQQSDPRVIVLECSGIPDIEYTALVKLAEAEQRLHERGVVLWLAAVNPDVLPVLARSQFAVAASPDRLFANLHKALEAWERRERVGVEAREDAQPR